MILLRCFLLICVLQFIGDDAIAQSPSKDPMSWKDILNKAGPPVQPPPQEPAYVHGPGNDPNPPKFTPGITPLPATDAPQQHPSQKRGELKVVNVKEYDALYVRELPTENSKIVGMIPPEATGIFSLGESIGQWILVRYDDTEGWVNMQFIAKENPPGATVDGR
jgi:Bacterial SH3 domain